MRLRDVLGAWREDVKDEAPARHEESPNRGQRLQPLRVRLQVEERTKRRGDEAHLLRDRRIPKVAETQVEQVGETGGLGPLPAHLEHALGRVDADHGDPGGRYRQRDPAGPDTELHHGAPSLAGLSDVEVDVLGDSPAPRVVELGDGVVRAHGSR